MVRPARLRALAAWPCMCCRGIVMRAVECGVSREPCNHAMGGADTLMCQARLNAGYNHAGCQFTCPAFNCGVEQSIAHSPLSAVRLSALLTACFPTMPDVKRL